MKFQFDTESRHESEGEVITCTGATEDEEITVHITRAALEDLWAGSPPAKHWLDMFLPLENSIAAIVERRISKGGFEHDGSIFIKAGEF